MPEEDAAPFIQLGDSGNAPVLSYDIPQPSRYTGRNYIQLDFGDAVTWTEAAMEQPDPEEPGEPGEPGDPGGSSDPNEPDGSEEPNGDAGSEGKDWGQLFEDLMGFDEVDVGFLEDIIRDPEFTVDTPQPHPRATSVEGLLDVIYEGGSTLHPSDREGFRSVLTDEGTILDIARENPEALGLVMGAVGALGAVSRSTGGREITRIGDSGSMESSGGTVRAAEGGDVGATSRPDLPDTPLGRLVSKVGKQTVIDRVREGWYIREEKTMSGRQELSLAKPLEDAQPRLAIVETYAQSSYLGDYGAGRTIQTFSLLPGEQTTISVKTYQSSEKTKKEASSVLDSYEEETADEFGSSIQSENSVKKEDETNFSYHAEAKAEGSWGWGSAEVSGGVEGSTSSAREEFTKNVSSATRKHASKASSKRSIEVNTSTEVTEKETEETAITRVIENINVSRTLNFVFRQMNQEFISLLHLTDVRVAFHNGHPETYREVTLPELDTLLDEVIESGHEQVHDAIVGALSHVYDYTGQHHSVVEERVLTDEDGNPITDDTGTQQRYLRVKPTEMVYAPNDITVPGIILSATTTSLPTDGVIVEAVLGQGDALDDYATGLQLEETRTRDLANDLRDLLLTRERLAQEIVTSGDDDDTDRFERVYRVLVRDGEAVEEIEESHPEPEPEPPTP